MAHQLHLEKENCRQWVKAVLGLGYLKEGLAPFCDHVAKKQHKDILDNIKQTKHLRNVTCGRCGIRYLLPDHVCNGNNQCPFGLANCNCCNTSNSLRLCQRNVCGAIYDTIITNYASTPPDPNWKNTQSQKWTINPWSIAKCFINAPGYGQKTSAADTDCTGLLHVIINNKYFHNHIACNITGTDVFSKVRQYRNEIFHSSSMELEEAEANRYIDDMIAVLKDGKELINRTDAQDAVKKLEELKNEDFIITTENMKTVIRKKNHDMNKSTEGLATKDKCDDLKTKITAPEYPMCEQTEEMKRLKIDSFAQKKQSDYEQSRLDLKRRLIKCYREEDILRMSALPQQQEGNMHDFTDVYVRPRMIIESKDELDKTLQFEDVRYMSDIFTKDGEPIKKIYVLGEAGSGKSSFCKSLVHYWCLAHSEEGQTIEDDFSGVEEMMEFDFLFFLPLRHYTDKMRINEMLEEKYEHPALKKVLERESRTCLVVLDGLDEWASPASKIPERGSMKDYTVLTTSRPWKIATIGISDNEIRQKIVIEGFNDKTSGKDMIEKTVTILNKMFGKDKDSWLCKMALETESVESLKQTAIMLQQLICLWYDDRLCSETSRSALYTEMLDLFFDWNNKKHPDNPLFKEMMKKSEDLQNVQLPGYLSDTEVCKSYSYIIRDVSRLAYETLFNNTKETSLSFDSSIFERLKISNEIKTCCLQLGILSEDTCLSLSASRSRRSIIAFAHKSFQEYLAAVYIAMKFYANVVLSAEKANVSLPDKCAEFIQSIFSKCTSLDEIMEQQNVFIVLCGLETRIATSISKYIYDIVSNDERVVEYRQEVADRHNILISDIQDLFLNCKEEVQACQKTKIISNNIEQYQTRIQSNFYLGDIYLNNDVFWGTPPCDKFCTDVEKEFISPDSVISLNIHNLKETSIKTVCLWNYLQKCQQVEAINIVQYRDKYADESKSICNVLERNTKTLKLLSVCPYYVEPISKTIVCCLSDMSQLVTLKLQCCALRHEDFTSLCTFLSGSSHLKHIDITKMQCSEFMSCKNVCFGIPGNPEDIHEVDLSKHQQLQCLKYSRPFTVARIPTSLEIFENTLVSKYYRTDFENVFKVLRTANQLTRLSFGYDQDTRDHSPYDTLTDKLSLVLPLLHHLRELDLLNFILTDNILKSPSQMKSMKIINLDGVSTRISIWWQFVDSIPQMPLPVMVNARIRTDAGARYSLEDHYIERDEEEAWQYVEKHEASFNVGIVDYHASNVIKFSTNK